ncbi:DUF1778 domain-containing protein [Methylomicrobium album]
MLASALKETKNVILDQSAFHVDNKTFNQLLDLLVRRPAKNSLRV